MKMGRYIIATAVVLISVFFWTLGAKPLGEMINVNVMEGRVKATLIKSEEVENSDGSITYKNVVIEFDQSSDSEAANAIKSTLNGLSARKRGIMLPFEKVVLYETGMDSITVSFTAAGKTVELVVVADSDTVYDIGTKRRSFAVDSLAFGKLKAVIEQYGSVAA